MTSIIFYFLILIFNLNTLSASNKWDLSRLQASNTEHKSLVNKLHQSLNELERTKDLNTSLTNISSAIGNLQNTQCIESKGNFYKAAITQVKKGRQTIDKLKTDYLNELKEKCNAFLSVQSEKTETPEYTIAPYVISKKSLFKLNQTLNSTVAYDLMTTDYAHDLVIIDDKESTISKKWDQAKFHSKDKPSIQELQTYLEDLKTITDNKEKENALSNILKIVNQLQLKSFKNLFEKNVNTTRTTLNDDSKSNHDKKQKFDSFQKNYLDELKKKCDNFLQTLKEEEESVKSEQIQSHLNDTWDLSEMNQENVHDAQREELENLLTRPLNKGDAETVLNDQFKTITKLIQALNIKAQGSYSFWNNQQSPNDFNLIQQSLASLLKELKKHAGKVLSSSDSNSDDEYVSCDDSDTNSNQETKNPHDDKDKNKLTASDCVPQDSKKLSALAIIAQISNSLEADQLSALKTNGDLELNIKAFIITLLGQLNALQELIFIVKEDCNQDALEIIKQEISTIQTQCQKSLPTEIKDLENLVHVDLVPTIKNNIIAPLKNLCEQLPSVPASINNQSPVTSQNFVKEIVPETTNNTDNGSLEVKTFYNVNTEKNHIYEKNPTSIPKDPNSKPNKSTWFKPKIICGIAFFSITVYWFLKNYLFGKNPA